MSAVAMESGGGDRDAPPMRQRGCAHVYTGDGKGKTTAAMGLAARALGRGWRVVIVQFLKGQETGERRVLEAAGAAFVRAEGPVPFFYNLSEERRAAAIAQQRALWDAAWAHVRANDCDMLVLDEAMGALAVGVLTRAEVLDMIRERPEAMEIVLTGRDAPQEIVAACDYVSRIEMVKHPFEAGEKAREGVEM